MGSFDEDSVGAAIVGSNGDGFIEEPMEVFDTDGLVVTTGSDMEFDMKNCADFLEETFEGAAVVNDDQPAEADFE